VGAVDRSLEIDVYEAGVILDGDVPERTERADTYIVDPDVNTTEWFDSVRRQLGYVVSIADVGAPPEAAGDSGDDDRAAAIL
jgi:hypothetical protein